MTTPLRPIGVRVPEDHYEALRWLAYSRHTTVSALVASYVEDRLASEDMTGYTPLEKTP